MLSSRIAQHPTLYRIHPVSFRDGNDDVQPELHARALAHQVVPSSQSLLALRRQSMRQQGGLAEIGQRHGIECIEALCPGTAARRAARGSSMGSGGIFLRHFYLRKQGSNAWLA